MKDIKIIQSDKKRLKECDYCNRYFPSKNLIRIEENVFCCMSCNMGIFLSNEIE